MADPLNHVIYSVTLPNGVIVTSPEAWAFELERFRWDVEFWRMQFNPAPQPSPREEER